MSKSVLWKVIGYAGFYIAKYKTPSDDVTLTLLRGAKPVKLFSEMAPFVKADDTKGIYHIKDWKVDIPIQIIVTTELKGEEYAGFRAISKNPKLEDIQQMIREATNTTDQKLIGFYRDFLDLFSKLDSDMIEEAKRSIHYFTTFYINTKKRTKCFVLYNKFLTTKIQRKKMTLYVKLIIQRKNCYWKTATIFFTLF